MNGQVSKPDHIFDRDREWKTLVRFATSESGDLRLGIVSGRRRQGKTYLLDAAATTFGGFFFAATDSTETESLASFGRTLAGYGGGRYAFADWDEALQRLFGVVSDGLIVIDEFPYLMKGSPALPSLIQRALGPRGSAQQSRARMVLAGSAMSVMGRLLGGNAPLRGRASMEMIIRPFGYRDAARFWGISDPGLALLVHSVVGGTPAYRREFVTGDAPPRSPISIRGCCGPCSTRSFRSSALPLFRSSAKPVTCWRRKPTSATRPATMPFSILGSGGRAALRDHLPRLGAVGAQGGRVRGRHIRRSAGGGSRRCRGRSVSPQPDPG